MKFKFSITIEVKSRGCLLFSPLSIIKCQEKNMLCKKRIIEHRTCKLDKQHFWTYRGAETSLLYNIRCVVISRIVTDLSNLNDVIRWVNFITNTCTLVSICSSPLSILSPLTF